MAKYLTTEMIDHKKITLYCTTTACACKAF